MRARDGERFHHPDWIEGFGRTIAEALASGCVAILPEHFRPVFREAALYRRPDEVAATVREFHADWEACRLQGEIGRRWIERHYGPAPYLDRIRRLVGPRREGAAERATTAAALIETPAAGAGAAGGGAAGGGEAASFDVVHLGDFRTARETAWRVLNEARIEHELGYRTGLLQLFTDGVKDLDRVHPEIDDLVGTGTAVPIDPATALVETRLLVVHQPRFVFDRLQAGAELACPRFVARRVVVIHDAPMAKGALRAKDALLRTLFGDAVVWSATNPALRQSLADASLGSGVEDELWHPSVWTSAWRAGGPRLRAVPVMGRCGLCDETQWAESATEVAAVYPTGDDIVVRILGWPHARKLPLQPPPRWETFAAGEISAEKFIQGLDAFVYYPGDTPNEVPLYAIATALAQGKPVFLAPELRGLVGRGPTYAKAGAVQRELRRLCSDEALYQRASIEAARIGRQSFGLAVHRARLRRLAGTPGRPAAPSVVGHARQRVLFLSSNGVGVGHLTRLLAIARRMPGTVEPVFLTLSQALGLVRQCCYPVEYLPFHAAAGCDPTVWNLWLADHLAQILDFHRPAAVVFDGGSPYQGLLDAMAPRSDINLVWVRRGMWRETQNNAEAIRRQRFFDLIIEPADIAEAYDNGATAYNRRLAVRVDPIRLLDEEELLSRDDACARLGLDPTQPSCLIQLGAGSNRDIVNIIDTVLARLAEKEGMQAIIAEWLISPSPLDFWPGAKRLRGFPLSLYFKAFDFTVSAAGYNSFNEIISFGLPAIFMSNDHQMMDDQGGRARFAQENDAAFHLPSHRPDAIGPLVDSLLDPNIRLFIAANSMRISRGNGAQDAADAVHALI